MSRLIGVVKGPNLAKAREQIEKAKRYADLVEIRLDLFERRALDHLSDLPRDLPWIFTLRKKTQGGECELLEHDRFSLFEKCLEAEPAFCDIETDTELGFFELVAKKHPKMRVIGSFHDLAGIPEHLPDVLERMHKPQIAHYKIAVLAGSTNDALKVMSFAQEHKNLTCIAMGIDGQISRILSPVIGSEFCYAAIEQEDALFGQLSLQELCDVYRFKTLGPKTKIYALLGCPIEKSIGHLFHNKSFPQGTVYVKLKIDIPELPLFFSLMRKFLFAGFSVTMPLKEQLDRFLTIIDPIAKMIGSVNTIDVQDAHLIGINTDGSGALNALEHHKKVKGQSVAILGAGGSGRAIAYEAIQRGSHVTLLNRSVERAAAAAKEFGCDHAPLEDLAKMKYDILINTIPADLLFGSTALHSSAVVMDIIYWEKETPLLKAAREHGCKCVGGVEMFEEQARLQQKIWFK